MSVTVEIETKLKVGQRLLTRTDNGCICYTISDCCLIVLNDIVQV